MNDRQLMRLIPLVLIATTWAVYAAGLNAPFLFDDKHHIVENLQIRSLWPPGNVVRGSTRPVIYYSLAVNYALDELNPRGYRAANVAIHIAAGLFLFGILRRTLDLRSQPDSNRATGTYAAAAIALLWLVHPLQTGSVTYVIQRCESLMGMFFLGTLYFTLRASASEAKRRWYAAALLFYLLGMFCKQVMVTAPLVILLYDRTFLSLSWRRAFQLRGWLYAAMFAVVPLVVYRELTVPPDGNASAGFHIQSVTWWEYLRTQPGVLLHYLKLCFWPRELCFDYKWPVADSWIQIALPGTILTAALGGGLWGVLRGSRVGFLVVACFVILAPTSSIMPIQDLAFEHRMYLPLACVLTLAAVVVGQLASFVLAGPRRRGWVIGTVAAVTAFLASITMERNRLYNDPAEMWLHAARLAPHNDRAFCNAGLVRFENGQVIPAIALFKKAIEVNPKNAIAQYNLGYAQFMLGDAVAARRSIVRAYDADPSFALPRLQLAWMLATSHDESVRNGALAVTMMKNELRQYGESAAVYDIPAAAFPETGALANACKAAQLAQRFARSEQRPKLAAAIASRLEQYRHQQPHRCRLVRVAT